MEKGHLPWSDFMVHGVNRPLLPEKYMLIFYNIPFHTHLQVIHSMSFGLEFQSLQRVSNNLQKSLLNTDLYTQ